MSALVESPFFGITLTVIAYWLGIKAQKKTGLVICNNMIVSVAILIAVLTVFHIPYEAYYKGGSLINMFLGPATACMAVTIYAKFDLLKKNWLPVLAGCLAGTLTTIVSVLVMSRLFGLDSAMTASLLPKSVTTPIATAISESHGGIVSITVAAVSFVSYIVAGFVQNAVICLVIGAVLMVGTLFAIKTVTNKKQAE